MNLVECSQTYELSSSCSEPFRSWGSLRDNQSLLADCLDRLSCLHRSFLLEPVAVKGHQQLDKKAVLSNRVDPFGSCSHLRSSRDR